MPLKLVEPRAGKTPYWYVRGHYRGVALDRSTKETSRGAAAKWLRRWREEIDRGELSTPGEPVFLDAAVGYMAATGQERFLPPLVEHLGRRPLRLIDQQAIDEAALLLYPNATAATRNRQVYSPVSAVLKHAGHETKIRRPKGWRGSRRTFWLWPEQAFRIFAAADAISEEFGLLLRFLCYTGLRLSEALALTCNEVRLSEGFAYLPDSKNDDPRAVFLPPDLVARLANHPRGMERQGRVFRFVKSGRLYTWLASAAAGAQVTLPRRNAFHLFCHTWATWMRRYGGLDTKGLVATQRWRDEASASRYEHVVATEDARKAVLLPVENSWKPTKEDEKVRLLNVS